MWLLSHIFYSSSSSLGKSSIDLFIYSKKSQIFLGSNASINFNAEKPIMVIFNIFSIAKLAQPTRSHRLGEFMGIPNENKK
jgi:hypothetical protein